MSFYLYIYTVSTVVFFQLFVYSIKRSKKNITILLYSFLCAVLFAISVQEIFYFNSVNAESANVLKKGIICCWCLFPPLLVSFFSTVTLVPQNRKIRLMVISAWYVPGLLLLLRTVIADDFYRVPEFTRFGWRTYLLKDGMGGCLCSLKLKEKTAKNR